MSVKELVTHIRQLIFDPKNPRRHNPRNIGQIERSLQKFGPMRAVVIDEGNVVIAGNGVLEAAASAGIEHVRVYDRDTGEMGPPNPDGGPSIIAIRVSGLTDAQKREYAVADNRTTDLSGWDPEMLAAIAEDVDLSEWFFDDEFAAIVEGFDDEFDDDGEGGEGDGASVAEARQTLAGRFLVPPFTVLDARQGYWQDRKDAWLALGIRSELGRGENLLELSEGINGKMAGTGPFAGDGRPPSGRLTFATGNERADPVSEQITNTQRKPKGSAGNGPARSFDNGVVHGSGMAEQMVQKMGAPRPGSKGDTRDAPRAGGEEYAGGDAWVAGARAKGMKGRPPHGPRVTQNPDGTLNYEATNNGEGASGTSVFDPVLCELAYRWFTPEDGKVLDPFAGGSVRGVVAALTGRKYVGMDLSEPQVQANRVQATDIVPEGKPVPEWVVGDSANDLDSIRQHGPFDFVFSCPPYADLEVYSDDPRDLSNMPYDRFIDGYRQAISAAVAMLKDDRFACFVVGDVRDKKGLYRNFVSDTIQAFIDAGCHLYNEAVLVTPVGSLAIRVGRQMAISRKLGKSHQNVLVFTKGDPRKAADACGEITIDDLTEHADDFLDDAEDDAEE